MGREVTEVLVGAAVILAAVIFGFVTFSGTAVDSGDGYRVSLRVRDASGLTTGAEVRMAGIKVGRVESQSLDAKSFLAEVILLLDDGIELPRDTSARILSEGMTGRAFVELEPGGEDELLQDGEAIAFAQGAINVIDLLGRLIMPADEAGKTVTTD